jgi:TRAP-type C4-dicarboxylate transport system substrate-binding protein
MTPSEEETPDIERRPYSELDDAERAVVERALPQETIHREKTVEALEDEYAGEALDEAFTNLKQENRLFRRGNKSVYVMIRRDLF